MHARVTTVRIKPEHLDEATRIFRDSVVPAAREQPGFRRAVLLTDRATGKGISVTFWETESDLRAGEESGYLAEQLAKIAPISAGRPEREVFEVAVDTMQAKVAG